MKLPSFVPLLLSLVAPVAFAASANPKADPSSPAEKPARSSTFELPRFKPNATRTTEPQVSKARVTVDDLSTRGKSGVTKARKQEIDYLAIDGGKHWSAPLHGAPSDTAFVSFFLYASVGTVVEAGGAKLLIKPDDKPDFAQIYVGTPTDKSTHWRAVGGPVKFEKHNGKILAPLPVLTLRLDPATKEWDLFAANRLVTAGLRLADQPKDAPRLFGVSAGPNGAWVCGLVSTEENPLWEDANANGIDDSFERTKRSGALLAANASKTDRASLAEQWQQDQRTRNVRPWPVRRPRPDGASEAPPAKGK